MFGAAFVALSSVVSQIHFAKSGAWSAFPPAHVARVKGVIWIHAAFGLVALCGGALLLRFPGLVHEAAWGSLGLLMTVAALWLQDKGMKEEKRLLHID
jgi:hypothetical protein